MKCVNVMYDKYKECSQNRFSIVRFFLMFLLMQRLQLRDIGIIRLKNMYVDTTYVIHIILFPIVLANIYSL